MVSGLLGGEASSTKLFYSDERKGTCSMRRFSSVISDNFDKTIPKPESNNIVYSSESTHNEQQR